MLVVTWDNPSGSSIKGLEKRGHVLLLCQGKKVLKDLGNYNMVRFEISGDWEIRRLGLSRLFGLFG